MELAIWPSRVTAEVTVPGDKSLSHRGILMSAFADGTMELIGWLDAADTRSSLNLVRAIGVEVLDDRPGYLRLSRQTSLREPRRPIDCGNSGTTMRLGSGLLTGVQGLSVLFGDESLSRRPMERVAEPLRALGASLWTRRDGKAPLVVQGGTVAGGHVRMAVASAQVKSACLLAGLTADGPVTVEEPLATRDHTERLIRAMGGQVSQDGQRVTVQPSSLQAITFPIPGDPSSAAFWACLAALRPDRQVTIHNVLLNPARTGFFRVLAEAGARVDMTQEGDQPEPWGNVVVRGGSLSAFQIDASDVPAMVDEVPLVALLATQAEGTSEIRGAEELRVKESDRIQVTTAILSALGARIEERSDGWRIEGARDLHGAVVDAAGDHRMAMLTAVASTVTTSPVQLSGEDSVAISYPKFFETFEAIRGA